MKLNSAAATRDLFQAAEDGDVQVVRLLLEKGAKVNVRTTDGVTALWMAAPEGHAEVVKLLREAGAKE